MYLEKMNPHSLTIIPIISLSEIHKLTTKEIENEINMFQERIAIISDIIKGISNSTTSNVLLAESSHYLKTLDLLKQELSNRKSK